MPSSPKSRELENDLLFSNSSPRPVSVASSIGGDSAGDLASKQTWSKAIDRYVDSILEEQSQSHGMNMTSLSYNVEKSSRSALEANPFDDASFAPVDPFDTNGGFEPKKKRLRARIRENWKPLSLLCFFVAAILFISAGVVSSKNNKEKLNEGSNAVGTSVDSRPTWSPTISNTETPTYFPTKAPVLDSVTNTPSLSPLYPPTVSPTTHAPTPSPTSSPSKAPSRSPTAGPTNRPTDPPTVTPLAPSRSPTPSPTSKPSFSPSQYPSSVPSVSPTSFPSTAPSISPTSYPTASPTPKPTMAEAYYEMRRAATYVSGEDPLQSTSTAQSLAFHWLFYEGNPSQNLYEFFEQYATAVLYFSLTRARMSSFPSSSMLAQDDFTSKREVCGWDGVRCAFNHTSETVHITEICLAGKQLTGTIPSEIAFLPYLIKLDLADNKIVGTIPEDIYGLKHLNQLYLNNNMLQGTISPRIYELHLTEYIYLGQNDLTGTLPPAIGTNRPNLWRFFSVYSNNLSGPIPSSMRLNNAYMIDFSRNQFSGNLPLDIEQSNYSTLRLLYLDHNQLSGPIPPSLMQLKKLKGLFLNDNAFNGEIPDDIHEDQKLNLLTLRVQNNNIRIPVSSDICELDINAGDYELVELGVDCEICNGCPLCANTCY